MTVIPLLHLKLNKANNNYICKLESNVGYGKALFWFGLFTKILMIFRKVNFWLDLAGLKWPEKWLAIFGYNFTFVWHYYSNNVIRIGNTLNWTFGLKT